MIQRQKISLISLFMQVVLVFHHEFAKIKILVGYFVANTFEEVNIFNVTLSGKLFSNQRLSKEHKYKILFYCIEIHILNTANCVLAGNGSQVIVLQWSLDSHCNWTCSYTRHDAKLLQLM